MIRTGWMEDLAVASRARAEADMAERSLADMEDLIALLPPVRSLAARLAPGSGPAPRVVGEIVRRSPGGGNLREVYQPRMIAAGFARAGAAAVCVATEPRHLGGSLDHLHEVRSAHLPILQHDYLVTPYQVAQARVAGADAVMLHASLLEGASIGVMAHAARRYGIEALGVAHDEAGLSRVADAGVTLIGVACREPVTWSEAPDVAARLGGRLPAGVPALAWGGMGGREDIDRLTRCGYQAFMAGEALMRCQDPGDALWRLMQPA